MTLMIMVLLIVALVLFEMLTRQWSMEAADTIERADQLAHLTK